MRKVILLCITLLLTGVTILLVAPTANASVCSTSWGSLAKSNSTTSRGSITSVRAGRHECYDRLVFDVNGSVPGWSVKYVDKVLSEGKGDVLPVTGGAKLEVIIRAPSATNRMPSVAGFTTFRSVVYGGSFEGQTTVGLGVRARLPFRVFSLSQPHSMVVIDVARSW